MARFISKVDATLERPIQNVTVAVSATYTIGTLGGKSKSAALQGMFADMGDIRGIARRAFTRNRGLIRAAIAQSVENSYAKSGLGGTGRLLRFAARAFKLKFQWTGSNTFLLIADWNADKRALPHFLRRLFGFKGPDKLGRTFGRGFDKIRGRGYFIKFDSTARQTIKRLLNESIGQQIEQNIRKIPQVGVSRRLTAHRIRRQLRKEGLSATKARILAREVMADINPAEMLRVIRQLTKRGFVIERKAPSMTVSGR